MDFPALNLPTVLAVCLVVLAVTGTLFLAVALSAVRRSRWLVAVASVSATLAALALATAGVTVGIATHGYRALTREETAATFTVRPADGQRFLTAVRFPDGRSERFRISGDQLYVDAHILKWHPILNLLGLHTQYELARVGGRYAQIEDELEAPRTVYSLVEEKPVDMFEMAQRFRFLAPAVDAVYGSATFVPADETGAWELRISTTGLLFRPLPDTVDIVPRGGT